MAPKMRAKSATSQPKSKTVPGDKLPGKNENMVEKQERPVSRGDADDHVASSGLDEGENGKDKDESGVVPVNRKKQKRRAKEAAKRAASQGGASMSLQASGHRKLTDQELDELEDAMAHQVARELGGPAYSKQDYSSRQMSTATIPRSTGNARAHDALFEISNRQIPREMLRRRSGSGNVINPQSLAAAHSQHLSGTDRRSSRPLSPSSLDPGRSRPHTQSAVRGGHKDRIWNTSNAEERERIKEFWLSLGEGERRGLVRIEKEAVLKKMKEQQKHSCSCTVCGRKRTAIEEELEVLYDAYYEELETYANHQQFGLDASAIPPPRTYLPSRPSSVGRYPHPRTASIPGSDTPAPLPSSTKYLPPPTDEEFLSGEDEDGYSEEEIMRPQSPAGGIFNFGNSLTAKGGILTVADDLLKNDGKKFIDMMEQLAERRMQREEEAHLVASGMGHPSMRNAPLEDGEDEDSYDEEGDEEDDYNSEEEEEFEDDEMAMTEEQRMEEGRRMFQIFAARMFEQRVLTAYREKISAERQAKLIEEMQEDEELDAQRQAKKAKDAQKKREKRQKQKQAKDEEKAKREAAKAAEEEAARALELAKAEEQRHRKEEQRKARESEKRAAEEAKRRKEEEKQRQLRERKDQQAAQERKSKERRNREQDGKTMESQAGLDARKTSETKTTPLQASNDHPTSATQAEASVHSPDGQAPHKASLMTTEGHPSGAAAGTATSTTGEVPQVSALQAAARAPISSQQAIHASPRLPIVTPALPKAPTPARGHPRARGSPKTSSPNTFSQATSLTAASSVSVPEPGPTNLVGPREQMPGIPVQMPVPPQHAPDQGRGTEMSSSSVGQDALAPEMASHWNHVPGQLHQRQSLSSIGSLSQSHAHPPGFNTSHFIRQSSHRPGPLLLSPMSKAAGMDNILRGEASMAGLGEMHTSPPPGITTNPTPRERMISPFDQMPLGGSHSRGLSGSSNISPRDAESRPAPIKRPSSPRSGHQHASDTPSGLDSKADSELEGLSRQLGSSALIDDTEDAIEPSSFRTARMNNASIGAPRAGRAPFGSAAGLAPIGTAIRPEMGGNSGHNGDMWTSSQTMPYSAHSRISQPFGSIAPAHPGTGGFAHGSNTIRASFGSLSSGSWPAARGARIRSLASACCHNLTSFSPSSQGFHPADRILHEVSSLMALNDSASLTMPELLAICDAEGDQSNGGGWFECKGHEKVGYLLKHHPADDNKNKNNNNSSSISHNNNDGHLSVKPPAIHGRLPGDIGSPMGSMSLGSGTGTILSPIGNHASLQQAAGPFASTSTRF